MFSGIVEEIGRVKRAVGSSAGLALTVGCATVLAGTRVGDSIAVDGVCLTVAALDAASFTAHIQPVTARRSTLGNKRAGALLNLERSVVLGGRLGGHYVQGHVDGTGRIAGRRGEGAAVVVDLDAPTELLRSIVERGFIAVDGASLTVVALRAAGLTVSLVQHTQQHITLPTLPVGAQVNLEVDVIAKYVERLQLQLAAPRQAGELTLERLRRAGFA